MDTRVLVDLIVIKWIEIYKLHTEHRTRWCWRTPYTLLRHLSSSWINKTNPRTYFVLFIFENNKGANVFGISQISCSEHFIRTNNLKQIYEISARCSVRIRYYLLLFNVFLGKMRFARNKRAAKTVILGILLYITNSFTMNSINIQINYI